MKKLLITGASGFLGKHLLDSLLQQDVTIYALSRHPRESHSPKLKWLIADITDETSLIRSELLDVLEGIDVVIHAAALYDMFASHDDLYRQNVLGTSNLLHLVRLLKCKPHFALISTIAVAGTATCNFDETLFDVGQGFPDAYASTKFASESLIRSAEDIASRSVYRLGIVVGSTQDGKMDKIDGPYYLQSMIAKLASKRDIISKLKFFPFPYNECTRLYLIPVDIAGSLIHRLVEKVEKRPGIATFHVIGGGRGVSVRRALQAMLAHYDINLNPISIPNFMMPKALFKLFQTPPKSVNYINSKWTFSSRNLEKELPGYRYPSYAHFSEKIMDYADKHLFSKDKKS